MNVSSTESARTILIAHRQSLKALYCTGITCLCCAKPSTYSFIGHDRSLARGLELSLQMRRHDAIVLWVEAETSNERINLAAEVRWNGRGAFVEGKYNQKTESTTTTYWMVRGTT